MGGNEDLPGGTSLVRVSMLMMAGRTVVIPLPVSPRPEHHAASTTSPPADAPPSLLAPHPAPQNNTAQAVG